MTPSGWHDDTRQRDAGHDEMQIGVFRSVSKSSWTPWVGGGRDLTFNRVAVRVEYPFLYQGRITAFADICEIWRSTEPNYNRFYSFRFIAYEVKPKIYSVGGLVRQCVALEENILRHRERSQDEPMCLVIPVVPHDDPKYSLLEEMYASSSANGYPMPWGIAA